MAKKQKHQKGFALVFALLLILVVSVMASSLMFLSHSETWSSANYRLMSQSRYGAESGLTVAVDFIVNTYAAPTVGGADPLANYNTAVSPVTFGGQPVVLSTIAGLSNYPNAAVVTAFQNAVNTPGNVIAGNTTVNYDATATLLSMGTVTSYGNPVTVQMWQISANGSITGVTNSQEQVSAILERQVTPTNVYAAFATANGCSSLTFSGGGQTDSYDSSTLAVVGGVATPPASFDTYAGNIGSNGNLAENGSKTTIYGTFSTPDTGVGNCSGGNVTAWTDSGNATVTGGLVKLPQIVNFPPPVFPAPLPGSPSPNNPTTLAPGDYGDISMTGHDVLTLSPGVYNINSISESGNSTLVIASTPLDPTCTCSRVVLNVTGNGQNTPVDLTGGGVQNASLVANNLQINYAGTGTIKMTGGSQSAAVVYAPNASYTLTGGSDFFGAVVANTVSDSGGAAIHFDRALSKNSYIVSNYMLDAFSWQKF